MLSKGMSLNVSSTLFAGERAVVDQAMCAWRSRPGSAAAPCRYRPSGSRTTGLQNQRALLRIQRARLRKERRRRLLPTTKTLEKAIAAPASIGFSRPSAASGIAATL